MLNLRLKIKNIKIITFFNRECDLPKHKILMAVVAGSICFALVIVIANWAAPKTGSLSLSSDIWILILFLIVCALTIFCKRYSLDQSLSIAEKSIRNVRLRLIDKLRHTELQFLETADKGIIYARLTHETDLISQAVPGLINFGESILISIAVFLYIAAISVTGFILSLISITVMLGIFYSDYFKVKEELSSIRGREVEFFNLLSDLLSGFKEIKINSGKNNALFADIINLSGQTDETLLNAELKFDKAMILNHIVFYYMLAIIAFLMPILSVNHSKNVGQILAAVLFMLGFISISMRGLFINFKANLSVENLEKLESAIDAFGISAAADKLLRLPTFKDIRLDSVMFRYIGKQDEILFTTGPINLTIRQGEVLFIVGGNGSGKSTLLKLITGLYYPVEGGSIIKDNQVITRGKYQKYRELFSTIFTDFHLFKKLYGLEYTDNKKVDFLLHEMDIHFKTTFVNGSFTNINLSTGQRKRLAYIAAYLEDRPIYVFDEWAADQDPIFREFFYQKFLNELRTMNKTIIAVTHDDRYFDKADRVIRLEEGKIIDEYEKIKSI